jgi:penicillin-binding protein 1A
MVIAMAIGIAVVSFGIWVLSVAAEAPPIDELKPINNGASSQVFAADGTRLGFIQSDENRTPIGLEKIPKQMQHATVAIEDERFYEHSGVDINAIARAAIKDVEAGKAVQGGSTITQQLVRNLYISDPERDLERKIREAKLAEELEQKHSKAWILEHYLNTASYGTIDGRTSVGVEAAAQTYFNKSAQDLTLTEAAMIAGLPQSPSRYNPLLNPTVALERRNQVLGSMEKEGYITPEVAERAFQAPIGIHRGYKYETIREPYFFDYVEQELIQRYGVNTVRQGGLKVYTTIEPGRQNAAHDAIGSRPAGAPAAALVSIDPSNGHIVAMASSSSYQQSNFNLAAQGHRQPGSSMKVYVLTAAVRQGIDPDSTSYESKHLDLNLPDYGPWVVDTAEGTECNCPMTITEATKESDNTVFAQLDLDVGPDAVTQTAHDMGITSPLDSLPAEGIGGLRIGVSPLEHANGYATLASGGIRNTPTAITKVAFPDGKVDEPGEGKRTRVFSDGVAAEVTRVLKGVIEGGTGTNANFGCPAAGKTGTTDDFTDAWFAGYTPQLATAVWVGYPDARTSMGGSAFGGTLAAPVWHDYMATASEGYCEDFPPPQTPAQFHPFFGKYSTNGSGGGYSSSSSSSSTYTSPTTTTPSGGGYNPQYYAPGAGQGPAPTPPSQGGGPGN